MTRTKPIDINQIRSLRDMALAVVTKRGVREDTGLLVGCMVTLQDQGYRIAHVEPWKEVMPHVLTIWSQWAVTGRDYRDRLRWHKTLDVIWWSDDDVIEIRNFRRSIDWWTAFERAMRGSDEGT